VFLVHKKTTKPQLAKLRLFSIRQEKKPELVSPLMVCPDFGDGAKKEPNLKTGSAELVSDVSA